jgi:hypothetical protein
MVKEKLIVVYGFESASMFMLNFTMYTAALKTLRTTGFNKRKET